MFAANGDAAGIFAFQIGSNGQLTLVNGSPFPVPSQPNSMKVSPDGKFLATSLSNLGSGAVAMYTIGTDGSLSPVSGSPFPISSTNQSPGGTEINFDSNLLLVAEFTTAIDVFAIGSDGSLALVTGSPFTTSLNNVSAILSPDDKFLFTSDSSSGASSLQVASGGALSLITGSPFPAGLGSSSGVSINGTGTQLFVADPSANQLSVMHIASDGTLSLAAGSPILTGQSGGLFSLVAYPPKTSFAVAVRPSSTTVSPGVTATYAVVVTARGGTFDNSVSLTCSLPAVLTAASCQLSSPSVTPGGNSANSNLTVMTTGMSAEVEPGFPMSSGPGATAIWLLIPSIILMMSLIKTPTVRRIAAHVPILRLTLLLLVLSGCGGGNSSSRSVQGTASGSYTITISGQLGSTTRTATVQLVVQ